MGVENRKPIPKSLEKKFAATGLIICGTDAATAQVTGAEKVLTTAGHQFADDKCQPTNREKCHFERTVNGRIKEYPLDMKSLKVGGPCADGVNDWAVVKLRAPIPGVTPYEIPEEENILIEGEEIVQISGFHDNYSINGSYPRTMEICRAEHIDLKHTIAPIKHSCDTGGGSSGSAQFVTRNGKMIFVAININHQNKQSDGDDYYADTNYNGATPVSGRLLKAIRDAMKP